MHVTGVLSVRAAVELGYPFVQVVESLLSLCDRVCFSYDPEFPDDADKIMELESRLGIEGEGKVVYDKSSWNMDNNDKGSEIAWQMDMAIFSQLIRSDTRTDWFVVLQADELLHEKDAEDLRDFMKNASPDIDGFALERLYFWKDGKTIRKDWCHDLVRVFRPFRRKFTGGDGMFTYPGDDVVPGKTPKLHHKIYHYSRVGDPKTISKRVRNLDTFFHDEKDLVKEEDLPEYDFGFRQYDNYRVDEEIPEAEAELIEFKGVHPRPIAKLVGGESGLAEVFSNHR